MKHVYFVLKKQRVLHLAALALLVFLSFLPCLENQFVDWDDHKYILENESVKSFDVKQMFGSVVTKTYVPLTTLSFAVEYALFGDNPLGYHLNNILLHLIVVVLVYFFICRLGFSAAIAFLTALIFGIHPMKVESVAWVTERKDVLYAAFYVLSLILYLKYIDTKKKRFFVYVLICGLLSILSKPMAMSLPFILGLLDWYKKRADLKGIILEKAIACLLVFPIAWKTYILHARTLDVNIGERALTWCWTFVFYIKQFLSPYNVTAQYPRPEPFLDHLNAFVLYSGVFVLIVGAIIHYRNVRWLVFSFLYFFLSVFFLMRLDRGSDYSFVADRFIYLPSVGLCLILAVGIVRCFKILEQRKKLRYGFMFLLLVWFATLSSKTFAQCHVWRDSMTLWTETIKQNPKSYVAYINRSLLYLKNKQYDLVIPDCQKALEINPNSIEALNSQATAYMRTGKAPEAIASFSKAIQINANNIVAYNNRGNAYRSVGQFAEAMQDYDHVLYLEPMNEAAIVNKANTYYYLRQYQDAIHYYNKALAINATNKVTIHNRNQAIIAFRQKEKQGL